MYFAPIHIHTHTCTHKHTHTCTHMHTHTYIHTCTHMHAHTHRRTHTYAHTHMQTHMHIHMLTHTHAHTHTETHTRMHARTYAHTHTHTRACTHTHKVQRRGMSMVPLSTIQEAAIYIFTSKSCYRNSRFSGQYIQHVATRLALTYNSDSHISLNPFQGDGYGQCWMYPAL